MTIYIALQYKIPSFHLTYKSKYSCMASTVKIGSILLYIPTFIGCYTVFNLLLETKYFLFFPKLKIKKIKEKSLEYFWHGNIKYYIKILLFFLQKTRLSFCKTWHYYLIFAYFIYLCLSDIKQFLFRRKKKKLRRFKYFWSKKKKKKEIKIKSLKVSWHLESNFHFLMFQLWHWKLEF